MKTKTYKVTVTKVQPIKFPHWSEPALDYEKALENKGKIVSHFKTVAGRYGGRRVVSTYYRVFENGMILKINSEFFKIGITTTLSEPYSLEPCTKSEFDKMFKKQ